MCIISSLLYVIFLHGYFHEDWREERWNRLWSWGSALQWADKKTFTCSAASQKLNKQPKPGERAQTVSEEDSPFSSLQCWFIYIFASNVWLHHIITAGKIRAGRFQCKAAPLGLYSRLIKLHHNYTSDVSEFIVELIQDIAVMLYAYKTFGDAVLLGYAVDFTDLLEGLN